MSIPQANELAIKFLEELLDKLKTGKCVIQDIERESIQTETIQQGHFIRWESGVTISAQYLKYEEERVATDYLPLK